MTSSRTSASPRPFDPQSNSKRKKTMVNRFAALAACSLIPLGAAPIASADPGDDGPPPDNGVVASAEPGVSFPISGTIEIHAKPGTVSTVTVDKKEFKASPVRVTLKDTHIHFHYSALFCSIRSYATLTSSTDDTDDVVAYYGVTKAV